MDDEIDSLVLRVRADTSAFARDVDAMRRQLDGPLANSAASSGLAINRALERATHNGRLGFDELKRVAVSALSEIASQTLGLNLSPMGSGGAVVGGGLLSLAGALFGGAPGRATGGDVVGGRPYLVGERGPELFVPTSAGRVETGSSAGRGPINVTVNISPPSDASPSFFQRSGRQTAAELKRILEQL